MLAVALLGIGCASSVEGGVRDEGVDYARFRVAVVDDTCVTTLVETGVLRPSSISIFSQKNAESVADSNENNAFVWYAPKIRGHACDGIEFTIIRDMEGVPHILESCRLLPTDELDEAHPGTDYECARSPFPPRATKESG